jgi:hypothetical protein
MLARPTGEVLEESDSRMWQMVFAHVMGVHARLSFENVV